MCVLLKTEENRLQKLWLEDLQVCALWSETEQMRGQEIAGFKFEEAV